MTQLDPHRTLGVGPDAGQAEIKRAYRRLAKQYHPDSAGERQLSRFLAIQAAYEALVEEGPTAPPGRRGAARGPSDGTPRVAGRPGHGLERPATPTGPGGAARRPGGSAAGAAGAPGRRPGRGRVPTTRTDAGGRHGSGWGADGGTGTGPGAAGERHRRRRGRPGDRVVDPKATIGSTSYDGADREPFDPAWDGATWYGAGSGTYWTVNPKEYADPRKHGPGVPRPVATARSEPAPGDTGAGRPDAGGRWFVTQRGGIADRMVERPIADGPDRGSAGCRAVERHPRWDERRLRSIRRRPPGSSAGGDDPGPDPRRVRPVPSRTMSG